MFDMPLLCMLLSKESSVIQICFLTSLWLFKERSFLVVLVLSTKRHLVPLCFCFVSYGQNTRHSVVADLGSGFGNEKTPPYDKE